MRRATLIGITVLVFACSRDATRNRQTPPTARPAQEIPVAASTELPIEERWAGPLELEAGAPGDTVTGFLVRDAARYDALVARLPAQRVQMKQPAPPSDDPLLARPAIDFTTHMLVVVVRADTLEPPAIVRVVADGGRIVVTHDSPAPPPAARPSGIGGYAAAKVRRVDGDLSLAVPRLLEDEAAVAGAAGQLVTLRGELTRTKIPTLLGVDVDEGTASGGARAEATGWLEITVVTQAEIDARIARSGQYAHRGPGTFRRLVAPDRRGLAAARPVYPR